MSISTESGCCTRTFLGALRMGFVIVLETLSSTGTFVPLETVGAFRRISFLNITQDQPSISPESNE